MEFFTFVITDTEGRVRDFGTYPDLQCAHDTAQDALERLQTERDGIGPEFRVTLVQHDDDGSHDIIAAENE